MPAHQGLQQGEPGEERVNDPGVRIQVQPGTNGGGNAPLLRLGQHRSIQQHPVRTNVHGDGHRPGWGCHQPLHGGPGGTPGYPLEARNRVRCQRIRQRLPGQRTPERQRAPSPARRCDGFPAGSLRCAGLRAGGCQGHPLSPVMRRVMLIRPAANPESGSAVPASVRGTPW